MSAKYETEQSELSELIKTLKIEVDKESGKSMTTDTFIATVRKYTHAKKLTPRMLNELIEQIEVHQAEKVNGEHRQKLTMTRVCRVRKLLLYEKSLFKNRLRINLF